jgi:hypothetical protein
MRVVSNKQYCSPDWQSAFSHANFYIQIRPASIVIVVFKRAPIKHYKEYRGKSAAAAAQTSISDRQRTKKKGRVRLDGEKS